MNNPTIITYRTTDEGGTANAALVRDVFTQLHAAAPDGVRYAVLQAADGTFFHLFAHASEAASDALTSLPAFEAFVAGGPANRATPPARHDLTLVGNYKMLTEPTRPA